MLAWSTAALLQPPCEITALLFRIPAQFNLHKDCNTSSVSGRDDEFNTLLASEACSSTAGCCCLPPLPSKKTTASSSMPLNSPRSKCWMRSLQHVWTLLSDEGGPDGLQRADSSQHVLWRYMQAWNFWIHGGASGSWKAEASPSGVTLFGLFPREWLNWLLPSACKLLILVVLLLTGCWYPCCEAEEKDLWYHQRFGGDWSHWEEVKKQHSVEVSLLNSANFHVLESNKNCLFPLLLTRYDTAMFRSSVSNVIFQNHSKVANELYLSSL